MSTPSAFEQSLLELINRARTDPGGEFDRLILDAATHTAIDPDISNAIRARGPVGPDGQRLGVDLALLAQQFAALDPVAPLAWNADLAEAAEVQTDYQIASDQQTHSGPAGERSGDRALEAGYAWQDGSGTGGINENVYGYGRSDIHVHAGFFIDWSRSTESGIQEPAGHRDAIMRGDRTEIGIAATEETDPATFIGPYVVTEVIGHRSEAEPQLLGVVIADTDGDAFYDIGEGLGGVTITATGDAGTFTTTSWEAGGYQMALAPGSYEVTFSGGDLGPAVISGSIEMGENNLKLDAMTEADPSSDTFLALSASDVVFAENGTGAVVTVTAPDGASLSLGGPDAALFAIEGDALVLLAPPDFSAPADAGGDNVYEVQLVASGAEGGPALASESVTVTVTDTANAAALPAGQLLVGTDAADSLTGTPGADTLAGAAGDDLIAAQDGDDMLSGSDGADTLDGGAGNDAIGGGLGDDSVSGGAGNDTIGAGRGDDVASGEDGNDVVNGGAGDDLLLGGAGNDTSGASYGADTISGGMGDDSLGGGTGQDRLAGEDGNDALGGGEGDDLVEGGAGDDFLAGGGRDDTLTGGAGDDILNGGTGDDILTGGAGADVFVWTAFTDGETDRVIDFEDGIDMLRLAGVENAPGTGLAGRIDALDATDVDGGLALSYAGHRIEIAGLSAADFDASDVIFV